MLFFHMVSATNITEMPKKQNDTANEMLQKVKRAIHWRETGGRRKKETNKQLLIYISYHIQQKQDLPVLLR